MYRVWCGAFVCVGGKSVRQGVWDVACLSLYVFVRLVVSVASCVDGPLHSAVSTHARERLCTVCLCVCVCGRYYLFFPWLSRW